MIAGSKAHAQRSRSEDCEDQAEEVMRDEPERFTTCVGHDAGDALLRLLGKLQASCKCIHFILRMFLQIPSCFLDGSLGGVAGCHKAGPNGKSKTQTSQHIYRPFSYCCISGWVCAIQTYYDR